MKTSAVSMTEFHYGYAETLESLAKGRLGMDEIEEALEFAHSAPPTAPEPGEYERGVLQAMKDYSERRFH